MSDTRKFIEEDSGSFIVTSNAFLDAKYYGYIQYNYLNITKQSFDKDIYLNFELDDNKPNQLHFFKVQLLASRMLELFVCDALANKLSTKTMYDLRLHAPFRRIINIYLNDKIHCLIVGGMNVRYHLDKISKGDTIYANGNGDFNVYKGF